MSVIDDLHTVGDYIRWCYSRFNRSDAHHGHGFDSPWDESVYLVLGVLALPWDIDREIWSCRLTQEERAQVVHSIEQRINEGVPTAYLVGRAWFMGLEFLVDERVLIPRSPIAELIESRFTPWLTDRPVRQILDLCCGSGCIGIAAAYKFEEAQVDLVDISLEALSVAGENALMHQGAIGERAHLIQSDLFSHVPEKQYDLIISNPPYVGKDEFENLPKEYGFEPEIGLVSGDDGLDATRKILAHAGFYLAPEGILVVEVGNSQWSLMEAFPEVPFTWLDLEQGGQGVFLLTADQCREVQPLFEKWR